jgi:hypothetical protein
MSVEINRLMIGSYVQEASSKKIVKVTSIRSDGEYPVSCEHPDRTLKFAYRLDTLEPIHITKDIFELFAGVKDSYEGFQVAYNSNFEGGCGVKNYNNGLQFSYLHTFQMYLMGLFGDSLELSEK